MTLRAPQRDKLFSHVIRVSLSDTYVFYTIRLSFERRLIICVCQSVRLSVCPSVAFRTVTTHSL